MRGISQPELVIRLVIAMAAGLAVGLEREFRAHPAGIRTHALVAVGAALFTISGAYGFADVPRAPTIDPARIAAQVASGVGFLGAGAILRQGLGVRGLTTAATLWLAAALGVASGGGGYPPVAVGSGVGPGGLGGMRVAEPRLVRRGGGGAAVRVGYHPGG